jgi:DNA transformation protein
MFGGVGIYSGDLFFALIADDTVYFKADDSTRPWAEKAVAIARRSKAKRPSRRRGA